MVLWKNQIAREVCVELGVTPIDNYATDNSEIGVALRTIFDSTVKSVLSEAKYTALMVSQPLVLLIPDDKTHGYHIPADFLRPVGVIANCNCCTGSCYKGINYITNVRFTILNETLFLDAYSDCGITNGFCCQQCSADIKELIYTSFRVNEIPVNVYNAIRKALVNSVVYVTTKDLNTKQVARSEYNEEIKKANMNEEADYHEENTCCFIPYVGSGCRRLF